MFNCNGKGKALKDVLNHYEGDTKVYVEKALLITSKMKDAIDSDVAILITDIIPGDADEAIRKKISEALGETITDLTVIKTCFDKEAVEDKFVCVIDFLKQENHISQHALLVKMLSLLASKLDNNKLPESYYDTYAQINTISTTKAGVE